MIIINMIFDMIIIMILVCHVPRVHLNSKYHIEYHNDYDNVYDNHYHYDCYIRYISQKHYHNHYDNDCLKYTVCLS